MYKCLNCDAEFEVPIKVIEKHGLNYPPYEEYLGCPVCKSNEFEEAFPCERCGALVTYSEIIEYGSEPILCDLCYRDIYEWGTSNDKASEWELADWGIPDWEIFD